MSEIILRAARQANIIEVKDATIFAGGIYV